MEALEKPCELLQVISEGYDLILSHCMTIGLNYIIWHTQHESFSVLPSELCCLLYVRVCVCVRYRVTAYPFSMLHWRWPISAKKQPCFHLLLSLSFPLWPHDYAVTWRKAHLTNWQPTFHFPAALGKDHLTTNITARRLPQDLRGVPFPLNVC